MCENFGTYNRKQAFQGYNDMTVELGKLRLFVLSLTFVLKRKPLLINPYQLLTYFIMPS